MVDKEKEKYVQSLKKSVAVIASLKERVERLEKQSDIAIVGYACRFPGGANNTKLYWDKLVEGFDAVTEVPQDRFDYKKYYREEPTEAGKSDTYYASFLDTDVTCFDNVHFEISANEAVSMDPQHRLLMEVCWEALENAGVDYRKLKGSTTGVFVGIDSMDYFKAEMGARDTTEIGPYSLMGVSQHSAAGRIAYYLDLKGPAMVCNTACSSSLVAMNAAVESLQSGKCDFAVVGGVNLLLNPEAFIGLSSFHSLSPDGRCKTFDQSANGFGRGEGCGVILLQKVENAKKDGHNIEAIVRGIYVGQDGKSNGFYAPNGLAETRVIKKAMEIAKVKPDEVDYIETHGTGTTLGDFIESQAIADAFSEKKEKILVGAAKSNIGHLEAASGMVGVIKVLLSIKHGMIPPSIHFKEPNANIDWSKIEVVDKLRKWEKKGGNRVAGVNAFGISGTLAHVILEEYKQEIKEYDQSMPYGMITLSGKNERGVKNAITEMADFIGGNELVLSDVCYTSNIKKSFQRSRFAVVGNNLKEMEEELRNSISDETIFKYNTGKSMDKKHRFAFLFTGQGSVYKNIGKEYFETFIPYKECFMECDRLFKEKMGISVYEVAFGESITDEMVNLPKYSQPLLFAVEYSLTKVWEVINIKPEVVIGHSIGEYVAACYAGYFSLEEAVYMISLRVNILESVEEEGKMVGILSDAESVLEAIQSSGCKNVSVAAISSEKNVTLSGLSTEVDKVVKQLQQKKRVFINDLKINKPYHSVVMEKYERQFNSLLENVTFSSGNLTMISTVTGNIASDNIICNGDYWGKHLSQTVRFYEAAKNAEKIGITSFIEIGGNATLCGMISQCLQNDEIVCVPSMRTSGDDIRLFFDALKQLYLDGYDFAWEKLYDEYAHNRIWLPSYTFNRKRLWKDMNAVTEQSIEKSSHVERNNEITLIDEKYLNSEDRIAKIREDVLKLITMITGMENDEIDTENELFSFGFDSLLLITLGKQIGDMYQVDIPMDTFFTELNTIDKIIAYLAEHAVLEDVEPIVKEKNNIVIPSEKVAITNEVAGQDQVAYNESAINLSGIQMLFQNQLNIINEQNEILRKMYSTGNVETISKAGASDEKKIGVSQKEIEGAVKNEKVSYYVPYQKFSVDDNNKLQELQDKYVKSIIERYTSVTKKSKSNTEQYRFVNANARNNAGFRPMFKEMLYQLVAKEGKGSKIIDLDDNEIIDITMGFGVNLFGHAPEFVKVALKKEIDLGLPLGPMGRLAGQVAQSISELTGAQRVFFCNSGTEADMFALRIARARTGKKIIVSFQGSYHGTYDGVLGLPYYNQDGTITSMPMAPGITPEAVADLVILKYDDEKSLEYIKEHADDIAGVIVEVVQSRRPDIQPKEFLHKLRTITKDYGMALIFDEIITGFRIAPGGAQEYFDVYADIVTYGKVVGGGMPIGIVAGNEDFMNCVDGGIFKFGDDSVPQHDDKRTYVAGTFCHHPMAMASANAILNYIKANKEDIYPKLNQKTNHFVNAINTFFNKEKIPFTAVNFGSLFRINVAKEHEIFFYGLVAKGIYVWEGRNCFLSTEHSDEDVEKIIQAVKDTALEMKEAGFFHYPNDPDGNKKQIKKEAADTNIPADGKSDASFSLSLIQERLYTEMLITDSDPFDIVSAYNIKGNLDVKLLEDAIRQVLERQEMLRTVIGYKYGELSQYVSSDYSFEIKQCEYDGENEKEAIDKYLTKFNLKKAPLLEVLLIHFVQNSEKRILVFHFHHIASDGISMNIFVQELLSIYAGNVLPPLKKQYKDFVLWEKEYLKTDKLIEEKLFYDDMLKDVTSVIPLPYSKPKYLQQSYVGNTLVSKISKDNLNKLKKVASNNKVSLFMLLLAAVDVLLYKISGEENFAVTTPVSSRFEGGFDDVIGMFTNTVAISCNISDTMTFQELVANTKDKCVKVYGKMNYPYNMVIQELQKNKKEPFNVNFVYENANGRKPEQNGIVFEPYEYVPNEQEFELTFEFLEENDELNVYVRYQTELFDVEMMQLISDKIAILFNRISENDACSIDKIDLLTEKEKDRILNEFNNTEKPYPKDKTIVQLFEEQVQKTPDNIAVTYLDEQITYKELNERANALAHRLRELGVGPDDFVAIISQRNIEMIAGIYAIIKAGGAYVPIDPMFPEDRISYMVEDCKPKAVLLNSFEKEIYLDRNITVINLKDNDIWKGYTENLEHVNSPEDLVYCIYTSGTTGKPKGVMNCNIGLINRIYWMHGRYPIGSEDAILQKTTFTFDVSVWEIIWWSLVGAKVVLLENGGEKEPQTICETIKKHNVTTIHFVPSMLDFFEWHILKKEQNVSYLNSLKYVFVSGEALKSSHVEQFFNIKKRGNLNMELANFYGPTEASIDVTYYDCFEEKANIVPIGKPIDNTQIYIMKGMNLCGIGVTGELCIAGAGVARGYLNKPEMTKEKFIENPYGEGKMYRTGDLARWMQDGNIEYLGRCDDQVKIRGYRIELGEIENEILQLDYVESCVVTVKTDAFNENVICAYVVSDCTIEVQKIKSAIANSLPAYMIPSYIIQIDSVPVTGNGKVNKKALPDILFNSEVEYVAPQNETQKIMCEIFESVLGVENVGIKDDFFELGGHSLRATRIANQVEERTGKHIEVKSIFQYRTPEELALYADSVVDSEYTPIPKAELKEYYDMSSVQKRIYVIQKLNPQSTVYNMTKCIRINGSVDGSRLEAAIDKIIARHEILRTEFLMYEGRPVQKILSQTKAAFDIIDMDTSDVKAVIDDFIKPFDLSKAPLIRVRLVKGKNDNILMFDMHHIISDGMSIGIIINEFMQLYYGQELGKLPCQYKDYSEWSNKLDFDRQKKYWLNQFMDEIPVLNIPYDYKRPSTQSFKGGQVSGVMDTILMQKVTEYSKSHNMTDFMVFLGATMILMEKYSHQDDIVIGTSISGRTHRDMESMIGMFVNTLAMRGRPEADKNTEVFMQEIKDICLQAYENQDYLFEDLVENVNIRKDVSRNPLFDVMLVLQNNEVKTLEFDDDQVEYLETNESTAKFDLTFNIEEVNKRYKVTIEYCADLFLEETANHMLKHFFYILSQIVNGKTNTIKEIETADENEKEVIARTFNDTTCEYPCDKAIKEIFEELVEENSAHIALVYKNKTFTYAELNERVNSLANRLTNLGVGAGDAVAILADKSEKVVMAILAVVKIGAVYVPIDSKYPMERISYILKDCTPKVVVSDQTVEDCLSAIIDLNDDTIWNGPFENREYAGVTSDRAAYYMYTSGTTGHPKGSIIRQKSILRLVKNNNFLPLDKKTVMALTGSIAFDATTLEMWGPLLNGGTLVILDKEELLDLTKLKDSIKQKGINTMWLTSALFNQFFAMEESTFDELSYLLIGGEKLSDTHVRRFKERNNSVVLINGYGPTENTTFTTTYEIPDEFEFIPIGKPIANTKVYIMRDGLLCGIGVPGELCTAGDGVSLGYLHKEELTKEKFVANPFGEGLLYHTGDLARWLPDGNIDYLGRMDEQIKLRGFRIELEEVEEALKDCKDVSDATVLFNREKQALCAYVIGESVIDKEEIRNQLGKRLPEYMIPAFLMQIDSIPLTNNGKVDKRSLPDIFEENCREYVAPTTEKQEVLCKILENILDMEPIGINDRFFEVGGDSIKAIRVVSALREAGYEMDFVYLMRNGTVQEIAEYIQEGRGILWEQGEVVGEVIDTPILKMFKRLSLMVPEHYNQAVMFKIDKNENMIKEALKAVILHHDMLRAVYVDNKLVIRPMDADNLFSYEVVEVIKNTKEFIESYANKVQKSMDIKNGPMVKAVYFKSEDENIVLLCIHHLVIDGISWRIILSDLNLVLESIEKGEEIKLPLKTASYIEWGKALIEYKDSYMIKREKEYWNDVLAEVDDNNVVGDKGDANETYKRISTVFTKEETSNLLFKCNHAYNTQTNDLLLAAFTKAIGEVFNKTKVAVKLEGHGREHILDNMDIDRTVGWFTSIYPVVFMCNNAVSDAVVNTKEILRKVPNHGIGFGVLLDEIPNKEISICYNFLGEMDAEFSKDNQCDYSVGESISKQNKLNGNLNFDGIIIDGELKFEITYDEGMYTEQKISQMAQVFHDCVIEVISFCMEEKASNKTMSDYGTVEMEKTEFDEIMNMFD